MILIKATETPCLRESIISHDVNKHLCYGLHISRSHIREQYKHRENGAASLSLCSCRRNVMFTLSVKNVLKLLKYSASKTIDVVIFL